MVFFTSVWYEVMLLLVFGSLMITSTPVGIEIGIRPSFDPHLDVAEKVLLDCCCCCHAGRRKDGKTPVVLSEAGIARWNALPLARPDVDNVAIGS